VDQVRRHRPEKIDGKYWMYWLGTASDGTIRWASRPRRSAPLVRRNTNSRSARRPGQFDSRVVEPGPPPVITPDGIVLIYNGADDHLVYRTGVAVFDRHDPRKLLSRSTSPIFAPEKSWEKTGQVRTLVFVEGMIPVPDAPHAASQQFLFYYGAADKYIGVARSALQSLLPGPIASAQAQSQPQIDYHQHLLMPTDKSPQGFLASDLIQLLDDAHIRRALVLSMAIVMATPINRPSPTNTPRQSRKTIGSAKQVSQYSDRLRGFCGVDPLKSYALAEIDRCSRDPIPLRLKMHFGNSDVNLDNPDDVASLRKVFQSAAAHHMAIVVHIHASITSHRPYGAKEAQIFLTQVLPPHPAPTSRSPFRRCRRIRRPRTDDALARFHPRLQDHDPT